MSLDSLMQQLDKTIQGAKRVPLTDQFRVDKERVYEILDGIRAEMGQGAAADQDVLAGVDAFDDALHNAAPVPLTDQVRLERSELDTLTGRLRDAIARGNRPSPTN